MFDQISIKALLSIFGLGCDLIGAFFLSLPILSNTKKLIAIIDYYMYFYWNFFRNFLKNNIRQFYKLKTNYSYFSNYITETFIYFLVIASLCIIASFLIISIVINILEYYFGGAFDFLNDSFVLYGLVLGPIFITVLVMIKGFMIFVDISINTYIILHIYEKNIKNIDSNNLNKPFELLDELIDYLKMFSIPFMAFIFVNFLALVFFFEVTEMNFTSNFSVYGMIIGLTLSVGVYSFINLLLIKVLYWIDIDDSKQRERRVGKIGFFILIIGFILQGLVNFIS